MFQSKSLVVTENLPNKQKQQLRPYTNGNLHKLMEVSGSRNSEAKCVTSSNNQNISSAAYIPEFLQEHFFPKAHHLKQSDDRIQSKYSKAHHREVMVNPWPHLKSDFPIKKAISLKRKQMVESPFPTASLSLYPKHRGNRQCHSRCI